MNVQLGRGKVHHSSSPESVLPACGGNRASEGYRKTDAPVGCKNCLVILAKEEADAAEAVEEVPEGEPDHIESIMGGKVHLRVSGSPVPFPLCSSGSRNTVTRYRIVNAPVSCKECSGVLVRRASRLAREAAPTHLQNSVSESAGQDAAQSANVALAGSDEVNQGEPIMANDVNTDEGKAVIEQIDANIERAASLVEVDNAEGLAELAQETETLISSLGGKGSIAVKQAKRGEWTAAATAAPKPKAEVKKVTQGVVVEKTYDQFEGVTELVSLGAEKLAEGVKLHLKASEVAKEVAAVGFDIWTRIPNKAGAPDLLGHSDQAKKASGAMIRLAGEGFEQTYDNGEALKKLARSVQVQRSDVRAEWLRSLDEDTEEAAERRTLMNEVLVGKPEDVPASQFVADFYGTETIGATEKKRIAEAEKRALAAGSDTHSETDGDSEEGEGPSETGTADERVVRETKRILSAISKASPDDFESASEEIKETIREQLEAGMHALRAMIKATI